MSSMRIRQHITGKTLLILLRLRIYREKRWRNYER